LRDATFFVAVARIETSVITWHTGLDPRPARNFEGQSPKALEKVMAIMPGFIHTARDRLLRLIFRVHQSPRVARGSRHVLHLLFSRMSFALPVQKLRETPTLLAFRHPQPAYPLHILLVPRREIASLMELDPAQDAAFLADLFAAVQSLVAEFHLEQSGYRLIVNGGEFQDFPYLHFHLTSSCP
jgi:histidine triad (HIT) family protein